MITSSSRLDYDAPLVSIDFEQFHRNGYLFTTKCPNAYEKQGYSHNSKIKENFEF